MKQPFLRLRKLQWQLSLSYIVVVIVAIPTLFGVGIAIILLTPPLSPSQELVMQLGKASTSLLTKDSAPDFSTDQATLVLISGQQHSFKQLLI